MSSRSFFATSQNCCACSRRNGSRPTTAPSSVSGRTIFSGPELMLSFFNVTFPCLSCILQGFQASLVRRRFYGFFFREDSVPEQLVLTSDDLIRPTKGNATPNEALLSGEPPVTVHY